MDRRTFLGVASAAILVEGLNPVAAWAAAAPGQIKPLKPMALGLLINPFSAPDSTIKRVRDLGFSNCFLSLDGYLNGPGDMNLGAGLKFPARLTFGPANLAGK